MAIDPEPAQLLRTLLATLGPNGRDPLYVTRSETTHWPPSLFNALLETALLRPAGSANIVVCPGCDHACAIFAAAAKAQEAVSYLDTFQGSSAHRRAA